MARFFIHRPVFAWVLAVVTMLVGALGLQSLAIEQYPQIAPTTVRIGATYNGASAVISNSYATGNVNGGDSNVGGLVGMNAGGATISSSHATE